MRHSHHFQFGRLSFWSSFILVDFILVVFHFGCLSFWSSSILVVFYFGLHPFWLFSILVRLPILVVTYGFQIYGTLGRSVGCGGYVGDVVGDFVAAMCRFSQEIMPLWTNPQVFPAGPSEAIRPTQLCVELSWVLGVEKEQCMKKERRERTKCLLTMDSKACAHRFACCT